MAKRRRNPLSKADGRILGAGRADWILQTSTSKQQLASAHQPQKDETESTLNAIEIRKLFDKSLREAQSRSQQRLRKLAKRRLLREVTLGRIV